MIDIAYRLFQGCASFFNINVPGLSITFFQLFIAYAIIHAIITVIYIVYGIQSTPNDIVTSTVYDTYKDTLNKSEITTKGLTTPKHSSPKQKNNKFNNYPQRKIDTNSLEIKALKKSGLMR